MARTRRIYNKLTMKKTLRNDITREFGEKPWGDMTKDEQKAWVSSPLRNAVQVKGFIYHPYASGLCMGNCPHCRDPTKDQRHLRKIRKREFRHDLVQELTPIPSEAEPVCEWKTSGDNNEMFAQDHTGMKLGLLK